MEQSRCRQPRHERRIFDRIPEPPAAPAKLVISPVTARRNAERQENPRAQHPWPHRLCKGGTDIAGNHRANSKRKRDGQADIAKIKRWRMESQTRVLQQW